MKQMLTRELNTLDDKHNVVTEIIHDDWRPGIERAQGDFILLLEYDSALQRGDIARMFEPIVENPHYRKLSMITPKIEFDDSDPLELSFMQPDGMIRPTGRYQCRIGSIAGSLIRKHSLKKHIEALGDNLIDSSYSLSIAFWNSGLRILHEPKCIYQSPKSVLEMDIVDVSQPSVATITLWTKEMII